MGDTTFDLERASTFPITQGVNVGEAGKIGNPSASN